MKFRNKQYGLNINLQVFKQCRIDCYDLFCKLTKYVANLSYTCMYICSVLVYIVIGIMVHRTAYAMNILTKKV